MPICTERPLVIAIVGGGLSGLSFAFFLRATLSARITIFESRSRQSYDEGHLTLAPNALYQLDQLGLYEAILARGYTFEELQICSGRGNGTLNIGSVANGSRKRYGYPAVRISRQDLRQIFLAEIAEDPMVTIKFGKKLVDIFEGMDYNGAEENVYLRFADGFVSGFDYVVGADGVHSRAREVFTKDEPTFTGFVSVEGGEIFRASLSTEQILPCMFLGRTDDMIIAPTSADGSVVSGFITLEIDTQAQHLWSDLLPTHTEIVRLIQQRYCTEPDQWPKAVQQICQQMCDSANKDRLTIWPLYRTPELHDRVTASGRIILLGDAAHAMVGGQSAAMALEDAASLAKVFDDVFNNNCREANLELPAALRRWQDQRDRRCRDVENFVNEGEVAEDKTGTKPEQILKEWSLWLHLFVKGIGHDSARVYGYREPGPHRGLHGVDSW